MKSFLCLSLALILLASCQKENSSTDKFAGDYLASAALDFRCSILPAEKLPRLKVTPGSGDTYDLALTQYLPSTTTTRYQSIQIKRDSSATGYKLTYRGQDAGNWSYLEGFGDVLRFNYTDPSDPNTFVFFIGSK
jgi:hypothetical protein